MATVFERSFSPQDVVGCSITLQVPVGSVPRYVSWRSGMVRVYFEGDALATNENRTFLVVACNQETDLSGRTFIGGTSMDFNSEIPTIVMLWE